MFPICNRMVMRYGELVQLFFIVSGYTMMLTFGNKVDVAGLRSLYLRRVFRIVPLVSKAYRPKTIATVA